MTWKIDFDLNEKQLLTFVFLEVSAFLLSEFTTSVDTYLEQSDCK